MINKTFYYACIFSLFLFSLQLGAKEITQSNLHEKAVKGGIYNSWAYTNIVTVSNVNNPNNLTDYSVLLQVNTAELISAGKMNADGSDIRFTTNFNDELSYWIDPGIQNERGINKAITHIWVKVPLIPGSSTKTIYMLYGYVSATAKSNIGTTFLLGDDFDDNWVDGAKWEVLSDNAGQLAEQNGRIEHLSPQTSPQSNSYLFSNQSFTGPCVVEMQFKKGGYVYRTAGLNEQPRTNTNVALFSWADWGAFGASTLVNGTQTDVTFRDDYWSRSENPEYYLKIIRHPDGKFSFYEDIPSFEPGGAQSFFGQPSGSMSTDVPLRVFTWEGVWVSAWWLWDRYEDNIRVRKYSEPEPTAEFSLETEPTVNFTVDMENALADNRLFFDPAQHDVYISGSLNDSWPVPGSNAAYKLTDIGGLKYNITLSLNNQGEVLYKYFIVPQGSGAVWSYGEWPGVPNRTTQFNGTSLVINDKWGVIEGWEFPRDFDNNIYHAITIGSQKWLNKNLFTTHYNNGDLIDNVTDNYQWTILYSGAYCYYNNDHANYANNYGAMYNWYAVGDSRGICPVGWKVPSDNDWKELEMYLGMTQGDADAQGWRGSDQGYQLKNSSGWDEGGNGSNSSGFGALPGGRRSHITGGFDLIGDNGYWFTSSAYNSTGAWHRNMNYYTNQVLRDPISFKDGYSVRCVKEKDPLPNYTLNFHVNNQNGSVLDSVKIIFRNTSNDTKSTLTSTYRQKSKIVRPAPEPIDDKFEPNTTINKNNYSKTTKLYNCPFDFAKFNSIFREYDKKLNFYDRKVELLHGTPADWGFEIPADVSPENLLGITIYDVWYEGSSVKMWINTIDLSLYIPDQNIFPDYDPTYGPIWIYDANSGFINPCLMTINFRATPRLPDSGYWWGGEFQFEYLHSSTQIVQTDINGFAGIDISGGDYYYKASKTGYIKEESTFGLYGNIDHYITLFSGFDGGDGSEANPFQIANATQLNYLCEFLGPDYSDMFFVLTSDIELGTAPWNQNEGWEPIGDFNNRFYGKFNGNGYVIRNLTINRPQQDYVGLFAYARFAFFNNIYLENIAINGKSIVGGLVGRMNASGILNCRSNGTAYANENWAGGLVGITYNSCNIIGCYSNANISAQGYSIGGLTGTLELNSKIENCFATGSATASYHVGGLVGWIGSSTINNSYSIGAVTGSTNYGGLVGGGEGENIFTNSYWNIETSNQTISFGGEGRTTAQMKSPFDQNTYISWDFNVAWFDDVESTVNNGYPFTRFYVFYYPAVETDNNITDISETGAKVTGNVLTEGTSSVYERGFVWSHNPNPNLSNNYDGWSSNGSGTGLFDHLIVGLSAKTVYYVRAYAKNSSGTAYGLQESFITNSEGTFTVYYNNPEKWAEVSIWIWGGDGSFNADWPGKLMSPPVEGSIWYSFEVPNSYGKLLFNNNNHLLQSQDLARNKRGWFDGTQWYDSEPFNTEGNLTDIDGNKYRTVTIGNQTWMAQNLKTTHYRDGSQIIPPGVQYWYNNVERNKYIYGALYNWYAVTNPNSLCPDGWRIPTVDDWNELMNFAGSNAGGKLKTTGTIELQNGIWITPNTGATNEYGFGAVPGGYFNTSVYTAINFNAIFWSSTEAGSNGKYFNLAYNTDIPNIGDYSKNGAFSVRCIWGSIITEPTINTVAVSAISQTSAVSGGSVTSDGGDAVTERGVVWSTSQNPTTTSNLGKTSNGTGTGSFTSNLTNLTSSTYYYVRAYATNSVGTAYGNQVEFTTPSASVPTLSTKPVQLLSASSASSGGVITTNGGAAITAKGVVWSTSQGPTITGYQGITNNGSGDGEFTSSMTSLAFNTRYYVRAYATNSIGTAYGNQVEFTTANAIGFNVVNQSGGPIASATVELNGETKYTDSNGNAIFYRGSGTFTYGISASGYISTTGSVTVSGADVPVNIRLVAESSSPPTITGESSVCLGSVVIYGLSGASGGTWELDNGTIVYNSENIVTVLWSTAATKGAVRYRVVDGWGYTTTYNFNVDINTVQVVNPYDRPVIHAKGSIPILICTTPNLTYQWIKNGDRLQGQTEQYYVARNQAGYFNVQVKYSNNCPSTSDGQNVSSKSAQDLSIAVYPNPSRGEFTLQVQGEPQGNGVVRIMSTLGKVLYEEKLGKNGDVYERVLSMDLTPGIYIISFQMDSSDTVTSKLTIF